MKNKLINFIFIIVFYTIMSIISVLGMLVLAYVDYFKWSGSLLVIIAVAVFTIGVFQLFTNKLNIKNIGGKVWGVVLITSVIFILPLFLGNTFNKLITEGCLYNNELAAEVKKNIILAQDKEEMLEILKPILTNRTQESVKEYNKVSYDNVNIYYDDDKYISSVKQIKQVLNIEYEPLLAYFKAFIGKEVNVIIVDKIDKIDGFVGKNTGAYYNPITDIITTLPISNFSSFGEFKSVIFHEYTHYALKQEFEEVLGADIDIPKWFDEGLATYFEEKYYLVVDEATNTTEYIGDITKDNNFKGENGYDYYQSSKYVVKYMLEKGGNEFIINLINDMAKTKDIYKSVENILGESFSEIENKVLIGYR